MGGAAALAAFLFLSAGAALAQQPGEGGATSPSDPLAPLSLFPRAPSSDEARAAESESRQAEIKVRSGIEINRLSNLAPETVGLLSLAQGGYGLNLWQGSSRRSVENLLALLPGELASASLRDMARRLLLSEAAAPQLAPDERISDSLLVLRAQALLRLGETDALNKLLRLVPATANDREEIARLRFAATLLAGEQESACIIVRNVLPRFEGALFWQKAQITCLVLQNNEAAAVLGLDLLREGGDGQADFEQAVNAALGYGPAGSFVAADLLEKVLLARAGAIPGAQALRQASPGDLAWLARLATLSPEARLPFAELATARGGLPAAELATLYQAVSFTQGERAAALSLTENLSGARARALLFQTAQRQKIAAARAEIVAASLAMARTDRLELPMSQALAPLIRAIPPLPELDWFSGPAVRALLVAGYPAEAQSWLTLARQSAPRNPEVAQALAALWPLIQLANLDETRPLDIAAWAEGAGIQDPVALSQDKILLQGLLLGLEEETTQEWVDLIDPDLLPEPMPDAALVFALIQASATDRIGESLLLTLRLLGQDGPSNSHVAALSVAVQSLARLGLVPEARALAIEAAVLRGL